MSIVKPTIPYWEYLPDYLAHRDAYLHAVDTVFSSGRLILGSQVASFEQRFAAYCGAAYGVGVNSGTDAIFLALKALGIGSGDEVITVSNTAVPTVAAIRATGATPVFVDVEADTYLMDVNLVEARITGRTRCILPVHLCGQMVDMAPLLARARAGTIAVVEDCAQACGATYMGQRAGALGDAGAFSFYPTKILGAFGDGGLITTSRTDLGERLRGLRFYGMSGEYYSEEEGYNSRLDEVQAALLNHKFPGVDAAVEKRRQLAGIYDAGLATVGDVGLPVEREGRRHQYYLYTIRSAHRDDLMQHLRERGIETKINYPTPIHLMRGYAFLGCKAGDLPVTERLAAEILSLPLYPEMPEENALQVVAEIRTFFENIHSKKTL
jgi:dTDP-3-amino-2,3,6-trideoxy-4-keto-D-glucose/dTDP-3-amino-3,4,6-trideoxy-alpha-D-glucose/dTDP-2,6-dideoxy-D-kanosamine transaminase